MIELQHLPEPYKKDIIILQKLIETHTDSYYDILVAYAKPLVIYTKQYGQHKTAKLLKIKSQSYVSHFMKLLKPIAHSTVVQNFTVTIVSTDSGDSEEHIIRTTNLRHDLRAIYNDIVNAKSVSVYTDNLID
jgi:hypothetical protein